MDVGAELLQASCTSSGEGGLRGLDLDDADGVDHRRRRQLRRLHERRAADDFVATPQLQDREPLL